MLENANQDIRRLETEALRRRADTTRLMNVVRAIDRLLFDLEDLNLKGVDRVPARLRERAGTILEVVPGPDPEKDPDFRIRFRVMPMMDVLFKAQEILFRIRCPERAVYNDNDDEELPA